MPSTATPRSRNGSKTSQTNGYKRSARIASGQHSRKSRSQTRRFNITFHTKEGRAEFILVGWRSDLIPMVERLPRHILCPVKRLTDLTTRDLAANLVWRYEGGSGAEATAAPVKRRLRQGRNW